MIFTNWGLNCTYGGYTMSQTEVQDQIDSGRPFVIRWGWYSGGGHFVAGRGIETNIVHYMDPWPGNGYAFATYSWVVDDGNHFWSHTLELTSLTGSAPQAPAGISASDGTYTDRVQVAWSVVTNATGYQLLRSTNDNTAHGTSFEFWDHGYNSDGLRNPSGEDTFNYLAGADNFLKYEYEGSHSDSDSHPNTLANQTVGPIFAQSLIDSALGYSPSPSPTPPTPSQRVMNDFDYDGKTDRAVYMAVTGEWRASLSFSGSNWSQTVGGPGYVPAAGDYDGDGKTDPAIYHESTGIWSVMLSALNYGIASTTLGGTDYVPVPGDYDGDGKTDIAVYQEDTGDWLLKLSASNYAESAAALGGPGYVPVYSGHHR